MFWLPDDPVRFGVLVLMGTALVISSMVGGYKAALFLRIPGEYGAIAGIVFVVAGAILNLGY